MSNPNPTFKFQKGTTVHRPKGSKNKFTTLRQTFIDAFEQIGGTDELARWARDSKNRKDFFLMLSKMLPKEVQLSGPESQPIVSPMINVHFVESKIPEDNPFLKK